MELKHKYRLRVRISIGTIIDVHKSVHYPFEDMEFLPQFEQLKKTINHMDMSEVSELDVLMVEQAPNALLGEFRTIFEKGDYGPVYDHLKN